MDWIKSEMKLDIRGGHASNKLSQQCVPKQKLCDFKEVDVQETVSHWIFIFNGENIVLTFMITQLLGNIIFKGYTREVRVWKWS